MEQKVTNIFKQSCLSASALGMCTGILNNAPEWKRVSMSDLAEAVYAFVHTKCANTRLQYSVLTAPTPTDIPTICAMIFGLYAWPVTSVNDVLSFYAALLLLAAKDSKVIEYDNSFKSVAAFRSHIESFDSLADLTDCLRDHFTVTLCTTKTGLGRKTVSKEAPVMAIEASSSEEPATADEVHQYLIDQLAKVCNDNGVIGVLEEICSWLKVAPTAIINSEPEQALYTAATGKAAKPRELDLSFAKFLQ